MYKKQKNKKNKQQKHYFIQQNNKTINNPRLWVYSRSDYRPDNFRKPAYQRSRYR